MVSNSRKGYEMEINEDLRQIVEGKNVCIVGPSGYLVGKGLGKYIDSFDVVCRVNELYPFFYEEDYGSRTDVMSEALHPDYSEDIRNIYYRGIEHFLNLKIILITWTPNDNDLARWGKNISELYEMYFSGLPEKKRYFISKEDHDELNNHISDGWMNSGPKVISILNNYKVKKLFITGFSFFEEFKKFDKDIDKHYRPGRVFESFRQREKTVWNPFLAHPQESQKKFLIENILNNNKEKIQIDSYLEEILNIQYSNVLKI